PDKMGLEHVYPLTCKEGHRYLIQFSVIDKSVIENNLDNLEKEVVDLVITLDGKLEGINNASTLSQMSHVIKEYLEENNVILFAYCDHAEIQRNKKNKAMSPQEFRSCLFSLMFDRKN